MHASLKQSEQTRSCWSDTLFLFLFTGKRCFVVWACSEVRSAPHTIVIVPCIIIDHIGLAGYTGKAGSVFDRSRQDLAGNWNAAILSTWCISFRLWRLPQKNNFAFESDGLCLTLESDSSRQSAIIEQSGKFRKPTLEKMLESLRSILFGP